MARLYRYTDSNQKTGYFLRGGTNGGNYTMSVTKLGEQLFDRLDYNPGIVNVERGPQIPSQLQWAMYNVGLLETGENDSSGTGFDGKFEVGDSEITEEILVKLEEFILSEGTAHTEIKELADILDIEADTTSKKGIWKLSKFEGQKIESMFEKKFEKTICTENAPDWNITVRHTPGIPGTEGTTTFHVDVEHPTEKDEIYTHQMYYVADDVSDMPVISTMTKAPVDDSRRVRIDRQRGRVLEAMSHIPHLAGECAGHPVQEVTCTILEEVLD